MKMVIMMKVVVTMTRKMVTMMMAVVVTSVEYQVEVDNTSEHPASLPATMWLPA